LDINPTFVSFLYIAMMAISFLVTVIYVAFNWNNKLFGRLMSITFILISYGLFTSFCASQGFFYYLPHLARTGYLVLFSVSPLLYLSLTRGLQNNPLKRMDFIHFIPSLLYLINYIPFFLLSGEEKITLFETFEYTTFDEGWIFPKYFVIILSISQILFYLTLSTLKLFLPAWKNKLLPKQEKRFLYTFFVYLLLLLFPPVASIITGYTGTYASSPILLTYISSQLIFFLILLSQPKFLYSKRIMETEKSPSFELEKKEITTVDPNYRQFHLELNTDLDLEYKRIIEEIEVYFENEKPYLTYDFDQKELSEKLNLSGYQVRTALKNSFSISFSDFVNYHRIHYLLAMLEEDPRWKNYTMATLANSIGFKSTNSLYLAFKKVMNTTPKEYIDRINNQETI
jgi:AraC-like DNA-binding protein